MPKPTPTFDSPEAEEAIRRFAEQPDEEEPEEAEGDESWGMPRAAWERAPAAAPVHTYGNAFSSRSRSFDKTVRLWPDADKYPDARLRVQRRDKISAYPEEVGYLAKDATIDDLVAMTRKPGQYFIFPVTSTGGLLCKPDEPLHLNIAKDHEAFRKIDEAAFENGQSASMGPTILQNPGMPREVVSLLQESFRAAREDSIHAGRRASDATERLIQQQERINGAVLETSMERFSKLSEQTAIASDKALSMHANMLEKGLVLQTEAMKAAEAARRAEVEARERASQAQVSLTIDFLAKERERDMKAQEVQGSAMASMMQMQMQMQQAQMEITRQRMDLEREQIRVERERAERELRERMEREERRLERERKEREDREERERERLEREEERRLAREEKEEERKRLHEERMEKLRLEQIAWQREQAKHASPTGGLSQLVETVNTVMRITDAMKGMGGGSDDAPAKEEPWWKGLASVAVQGLQTVASARTEQMKAIAQIQAQNQGLLMDNGEPEDEEEFEDEPEQGVIVPNPNPIMAPVDSRFNVGFQGAPAAPPAQEPELDVKRSAREMIRDVIAQIKALPKPYDTASVAEIVLPAVSENPTVFYAYCKWKGIRNALSEAQAQAPEIEAILTVIRGYDGPGSEYLRTIPESR